MYRVDIRYDTMHRAALVWWQQCEVKFLYVLEALLTRRVYCYALVTGIC